MGRPEAGGGPGRPRKKSRYTDRQKGLRGLQIREFIRNHYLTARRLKAGSVENLNGLLGHLGRCRGESFVRELGDELLYELRDYLLAQIADGEMGEARANVNLRTLRAVANYAFKERLVRNPIRFAAFLPQETPPPKALSLEESWRIGQAARAATGFVGDKTRDGYAVPAGTWWYAWYITMSRVGNRLTAMMLAERGDYQAGVLWLKAGNQKQARDQRLKLPDYCWPAMQDLLDAHDCPRLFPWPHDKQKPGGRANWSTLYDHFRRRILKPAGIELRQGVLTRVFRQTVATRIRTAGGDATKQLGHSGPKVTEAYWDPREIPVTDEARFIPEDRPPEPPGKQTFLFEKEATT